MAEKTPNQQLAEKLLFKPAYVGDKSAAVKQEAHAFAEGYKKFLDAGKTEREVAAESEQMLKDAGYQQFDPKKTYAPGDKVYFSQLGKAIVASTIGTRSFEDGFRLVIAHTDSPRLDLRPTPLYESDHFSYFKTHYYGGIRKYQWGTMPLAIHGVFSRADGTTVSVNVGEDENDPVFCITDLLPHLSAEQSERKLSDGIRAEELNILIGSDAVDDKEVKEAVKLNTMILLNEKYGITEKDFARAEIEIVPAYKSRDVGFDRSMIGGYGHDDRVDAYPALMAEIATRNPAFTTVSVNVGEDENDPVFCITDLLPHLGAEQGERKLSDGIRAEELNILIGSDAVDDEEVKEAVKLNTMILLNEKYGITEKDFARAEIEIVPAYKSRDVGFDRSMIGGYGHDDRVDAYPALMAEIATKNPAFTTVCVLTDKEEIGSDGVTGMQSMYVFHFMQELCRTAGQDDIIAFRNSVCLSADVTAAYDPSWASAFEPMNGTYAGRGIALFKYTGSRGKSAANDASAELVGYVTRMMDADDVAWQIGELGRLDLGGGGTIAKYVANRGIPVIDIGVPVLSMHSPFEVIHKTDLYMAYRAFVLFNQAAE